jgi:hypothetical protein
MGLMLLLRYLSVSVGLLILIVPESSVRYPYCSNLCHLGTPLMWSIRFGPKFDHRPTDQVGSGWVLVTGRFASVADLAGLADFAVLVAHYFDATYIMNINVLSQLHDCLF